MPNRTRQRFSALDAALLAALALGLAWFGLTVQRNLDYDWNWPLVWDYVLRLDPATGTWRAGIILQGLAATVRLALWTTVLALVLGTAMGLFRSGRSLFLRLTARAYVESVRNLPPLVLIFLFYFFFSGQLMDALGLERAVRALPRGAADVLAWVLAPPAEFGRFASAVVTLALYEGAYITEIVRSGIESVERGQCEAALAQGLSRWQTMRHIVLPQALRRVVPPLAGQFISTIKDSSIVAVISVPELTFQGLQLMASTFRTFEVWIAVLGLYLVLCLTLSMAARRLEARLARNGG